MVEACSDLMGLIKCSSLNVSRPILLTVAFALLKKALSSRQRECVQGHTARWETLKTCMNSLRRSMPCESEQTVSNTSAGLQKKQILQGLLKRARVQLLHVVNHVIAILGPEVKPALHRHGTRIKRERSGHNMPHCTQTCWDTGPSGAG